LQKNTKIHELECLVKSYEAQLESSKEEVNLQCIFRIFGELERSLSHRITIVIFN